MKLSLISLAAGTVFGLTIASTASANPIYVDNGVDFTQDGIPAFTGTKTSPFGELGYTATRATSIYLGDPRVAGTKVIDTNVLGVMNAYGFAAGIDTNMLGGTLTNAPPAGPYISAYPAIPAGVNINALNPEPTPTNLNGFVSGEGFPPYGFGAVAGLGGVWGLSYQYYLEGTTRPAVPDVKFTTGYFDLYYEAGAGNVNNGKQLLRLVVTDSEFQGDNLSITGYVSFDFDGIGAIDDTAGDSFVQDFFHFANDGQSFYSAYMGNPTGVKYEIDTNVSPPFPTEESLFYGTVDLDPSTDGNQFALIRQSNLDGSVVFGVPEPGTLALMGLALAGLSLAKRRRKVIG